LIISNSTICIGGNVIINATGVNSYTWNTGVINSSINVTPIVNTTYSVIGTDINGCETSTVISIGVNPNPVVLLSASSSSICFAGLSKLSASGALSYSWSTGETSSSISVSPTVNTTYSLTGFNSFGCSSETLITIFSYSNPIINIGPDVTIELGGNYQFNPIQSGAVNYTWIGDYLNSNSIINPITTPLNDITYILNVTSVNGCSASDTIFVKVLNDLIITNYMSPNGDGDNDTWNINHPLIIKEYSVDIINSQSQTIYHKDNNYKNDFDGTFNEKYLPDGIYYYFIRNGKTVMYKGSITLER
jgi:gliding motility-associated-like protein